MNNEPDFWKANQIKYKRNPNGIGRPEDFVKTITHHYIENLAGQVFRASETTTIGPGVPYPKRVTNWLKWRYWRFAEAMKLIFTNWEPEDEGDGW